MLSAPPWRGRLLTSKCARARPQNPGEHVCRAPPPAALNARDLLPCLEPSFEHMCPALAARVPRRGSGRSPPQWVLSGHPPLPTQAAFPLPTGISLRNPDLSICFWENPNEDILTILLAESS